MNYTYTVSENLVVEIWKSGSDTPFIVQKKNPKPKYSWNIESAYDWAEKTVFELNNPGLKYDSVLEIQES